MLVAAQRGDAGAQAALFEAHKHRVARHIVRLTGDPSAVDDLMQEVFIAAFSALPTFRGDAQVDTWLHRIATNKVRNWWDSRRRRQAREQAVAEFPEQCPETPEEQLAAQEQLKRFYRVLGALPTKFREAFTLRIVERLSLIEVSEILGVPISTVSYRTRRAEQLLCEALDLVGGER
jgi:RNA polymerase sigma-70 factor (ECF subfamily)